MNEDRQLESKNTLSFSNISSNQWKIYNDLLKPRLEPFFQLLKPNASSSFSVNYGNVANSISQDLYEFATSVICEAKQITVTNVNNSRPTTKSKLNFTPDQCSTGNTNGRYRSSESKILNIRLKSARTELKRQPTPTNRASFFRALRAYTEVRRKERRINLKKDQAYHESLFRKNRYKYAKKYIDYEESSRVQPIDKDRTHSFFVNTYKQPPGNIDLDWIKEQTQPKTRKEFCKEPIRPRDIRCVLARTSNKSTPGPDGIPYILLKNLPCIHHLLATLYNRIVETSEVPSTWQDAKIILLHKKGDKNDPANYRPIALTSTIGKVFHSILSRRLQQFCTDNKVINQKVQKGFINGISGCTEHSTVLQNSIRHSRRTKHAIHCIWLDLKNAFGSVRHDLLRYVLNLYKLPHWLTTYITNLYSGITGTVSTKSYSTAKIPLKCGVFQGDTLSPILFLIAINPILKFLETKKRFGYKFRGNSINTLAYADDISLIFSNQRSAQRLLNEIDTLFTKMGLQLKPEKCKSLSIVKGCAKDVSFAINGTKIDNIKGDKFKFLGSTVFSSNQLSNVSNCITQELTVSLNKIDKLPLRGSYKVQLYTVNVIPKLRFQLTVHSLTSSALSKLDQLVKNFTRKWLKIPSSTTFDHIAHPQGMNIRLPTLLYDHGHIISESIPSDEIVEAAIQESSDESTTHRTSYRQHILTDNRKSNVKNLMSRSSKDLEDHAATLTLQGEWKYLFALQCNETSFRALAMGLSESTYRFLLQAMTNTAPTMSYLRTINANVSAACPKCHQSPETLLHALNNCKVSLESGLFTWRHNEVLKHLSRSLREEYCDTWEVRCDLPGEEANDTIPQHILVTPLKPDAVIFNRDKRAINLIELTICWDTNFNNAEARKTNRYQELEAELTERNWKVNLITLEIGSRGFTSNQTASKLKILFPRKSTRKNIIQELNRRALAASHCIFMHRKDTNWSPASFL